MLSSSYTFLFFSEPLNSSSKFVFDENIMSELTNMGFPPEACKRATYFTKNKSLNDATNWLMEHISDPDFSDPFVEPGMEINSGQKITSLLLISLTFQFLLNFIILICH